MPNIANISGNLLTDSGIDLSTLPSGSGTLNYLSKWTSSSALGNSLVFDNGTNVGIGTTSPTRLLTIQAPSGSNNAYMNFYSVQTGSNVTIGVDGFGFIIFDGSYRFRLSPTTGNITIGGTTDAGFRLDVSGTFRSTGDANINGLTVGRGGGNVDGNTIIGSAALTATNTGGGNTAVGYEVFQSATTGYSNTAIGVRALRVTTSGYENTAVGRGSLVALTSGNSVVAIGKDAGLNATTGASNTFIGTGTGAGITTGSFNTIIGAFVTGLSSSLSNTIILADGQGNQRLYINNSGNVGIGTTSPEAGLNVFRYGTRWVTNAQTYWQPAGDIFLSMYSNTSNAKWFGISGEFGSTGSANLLLQGAFNSTGQQAGNYIGSEPVSSNQNLTFGKLVAAGTTTGNATKTEYARFTTNGRLLIGTTTESTYLLDVNGTARVSGEAGIGGTNISGINLSIAAGNAGAQGSMRIYGAGSRYTTYASWADGQYIDFSQNLGGVAARGLSLISGNTSVQMKISTLGVAINQSGTATPDASALLDVSSTTKGVLLPRMSGAQAEAIATPADGLVVYVNSGDGVTITSTGFWGRDAGAWVKLS